jgi:hypothetical protein
MFEKLSLFLVLPKPGYVNGEIEFLTPLTQLKQLPHSMRAAGQIENCLLIE